MTPIELPNLRRKRRYIHEQLDRFEPWVARLRADLAETEAAIHAVAPELNLPPRRYAPNPYFARGELPRLALALRASRFLKAELKRAGLTYAELAERLKEHGLPAETEASIKAKLSTGRSRLRSFSQCWRRWKLRE